MEFNEQEIIKLKEIYFKKVYQDANGTFLPHSSQPNPNANYEIMTEEYTPHTSTRYVNVVIGDNGHPQQQGKECSKTLPELYSRREECCGCTACYAICPVGAIVMRPDEEGFLYPVVDAMKCIRCYKCLSVCAFKESQKEKGY